MAGARGRWEHFAHGADIGIRGVGRTPTEAFVQAAIALTAVTADPASVLPREPVEIECAGEGLRDLFFAWLDAIVFEMSCRRMLFSRFELVLGDTRLSARLWGEPVERSRHDPAVEVKGPTFTELEVNEDVAAGEWRAQCVVDV